ncbi:MAG: sulfate adenylyltransferase, partial [Planctomycetaceae bacterium]|nr:sulfate adenylyltransferase [Planctomycetaceae bacterium]
AVMHAIYRQNLGCTHIIIGRKHADVPYANGENIWGDFDAHQIFDKLGGDLKIQPVKVGFAAYYDSCKRVDLTERHPGEKPVSISGKDIRATLQKGERVDPRVMRPSTSKILGEAMKVA